MFLLTTRLQPHCSVCRLPCTRRRSPRPADVGSALLEILKKIDEIGRSPPAQRHPHPLDNAGQFDVEAGGGRGITGRSAPSPVRPVHPRPEGPAHSPGVALAGPGALAGPAYQTPVCPGRYRDPTESMKRGRKSGPRRRGLSNTGHAALVEPRRRRGLRDAPGVGSPPDGQPTRHPHPGHAWSAECLAPRPGPRQPGLHTFHGASPFELSYSAEDV